MAGQRPRSSVVAPPSRRGFDECGVAHFSSRLELFSDESSLNGVLLHVDRGALDAYEHGNAETFAVEHSRRGPANYRDVKQRMSETLKVVQERGVLAQREYSEDVPASVHGAPRTVEVCCDLRSLLTTETSVTSIPLNSIVS